MKIPVQELSAAHMGIIGLGYVGLPLAVEFSKHFPVVGFDVKRSRIEELRAGRDHTRDFTYIDDVVEGVLRVLDRPAEPNLAYDASKPDPATGSAPYRLFNIGNGNPVHLMEYIEALEDALGVKAQKNLLPMQPGDVAASYADTTELDAWVSFKPATPVREGVRRFVAWYRDFYSRATQ